MTLIRPAEPRDAPAQRPASNAPAPARTFGWLARRLRAWLGIADQRHDFDALALTLSVKDQIVAGLEQSMRGQEDVLREALVHLDYMTKMGISLRDRLMWYEARVPTIKAAKRAYDQALQRERERLDQLFAAHPEWTAAEKHSMRWTGKLPESPDDAPHSRGSA
jgi:hypothetical protein